MAFFPVGQDSLPIRVQEPAHRQEKADGDGKENIPGVIMVNTGGDFLPESLGHQPDGDNANNISQHRDRNRRQK